MFRYGYILRSTKVLVNRVNIYEKLKRLSNINRNFSSQFDSTSILNGTEEKFDPNLINQDVLLQDKNDLTQKLIGTIKHIPQEIDKYSKDHFLDNSGTYENDRGIALVHSGLYIKELALEEEQHGEAFSSYTKQKKNLLSIGKGSSMKSIHRLILKWFGPFQNNIINEINMIHQNVPGKLRKVYGPYLMLLPPEKIAVIGLNSAVNLILKSANQGVQVATLSKAIGELIQSELYLFKLNKGKLGLKQWQKDLLDKLSSGKSQDKRSFPIKNLKIKFKKLLDEPDWSHEVITKVGAVIIHLLCESVLTDDGKSVFEHVYLKKNNFDITAPRPSPEKINLDKMKRAGTIKFEDSTYKQLTDNEFTKDYKILYPRYLPMIVPPKNWDNKDYDTSAYFRLKSTLIRTDSKEQISAVKLANMPSVIEGLNFLGQCPWRINKTMFSVINTAWKQKLVLGELPQQENINVPDINEYTIDPEDVIKARPFKKFVVNEDGIETNEVLPPTPVETKRFFDEIVRRIKVKNIEMHSLRCDLALKLWVAEKFIDEKFYFPFNLDFRGRAYPIPPNLNHLGSDLCRGLLLFDNGKPLGPNGLSWIKIHLANLFGINKITFQDRIKWTDSNMENIIDSVKNPLDGKKWWNTAESPYQALATCHEIVAAIESGTPETYVSRLPIHQDGSCNGLQHYAALGRDEPGGIAVNLVNNSSPQDVYSSVLVLVLDKVAKDCEIPSDHPDPAIQTKGKLARLIHDVVDRKVVKQTVMTSVYGVTRIGARAQIFARLEEKLSPDSKKSITDIVFERQLFEASSYLADLTLLSLREMFTGARDIMDWLATCAHLVASQGQPMSWITPLGLPVVQPYRKSHAHVVKTILQTVLLTYQDELLPVSSVKQRSAFPPNFVHSLDATHMLLTSLKMKERNLTFASVHDSYWTHACDIPVLNECLRECFIDLYEQPILENLRESLLIRYSNINFPPLPERGQLDLKLVKNSTYFFH